eukprot:718426-Alexandrium_andersonii.AAC.1
MEAWRPRAAMPPGLSRSRPWKPRDRPSGDWLGATARRCGRARAPAVSALSKTTAEDRRCAWKA